MQAVPATPGWIVMFATVFVIGLLVRLASGRGTVGVLLFLAVAVGLTLVTYGARHTVQSAAVTIATEVAPPRPVPAKPSRAKRPAKPTPPVAPTAPAIPPSPNAVPPSAAPPVAESPTAGNVEEVAAASVAAENEVPEAPITLYEGSSKVGRPVDKLPGWVTELADAKLGSSVAAFSSDRFASMKDAEAELWIKAQDFVARDLRMRSPEASEWWPPADLLQSRGFIVERCVERTTLEVGQFVEPMYRVHWKTSLSKNVRDAIADAWRPSVQAGRLKGVTLGFLCATAALALLNIILRSVAARLAARRVPTTQVA